MATKAAAPATPTVTNTWSIVALDCIPQVDNLTDYVVTSHWTLSATDGTYTGSVYGTASFTVDPTKTDYVPFDQLTEAQVISWTQGALGAEQVASLEAGVAQQIENQIKPPIVQPPLPWAPAPTPSVEAPVEEPSAPVAPAA